jgi:hypothetical protein
MGEDQSFEAIPADSGWSERNVRLLKRAVYIMGILIVVGTIVLVVAIVMKAGRSDDKRVPGFGDIDVGVPAGASIVASRLDGDRLSIDIVSPQGPEVVIVDVKKGVVLGRVRLRPPPQ